MPGPTPRSAGSTRRSSGSERPPGSHKAADRPKIVRIAAATISALPFGTRASTLRMKCTRQRCQLAPSSTAAIAAFSPVCASEMTNCVPASPRAFRVRRNAVQKAPSSESPTAKPSTSRTPSAATPVAMTTGLGDHPPVDPGLAVGGVQEHVGERLLGQAPVAERGHLGVEVGADSTDLGLGDPRIGTEGLDQVVDLPRAHTMQVGLHDHREQCLIDPPSAFQQRGEERPGAQLGDPQLQLTGRGGQDAWPGAVALGGPGIGALMRRRPDHRGDSGNHATCRIG